MLTLYRINRWASEGLISKVEVERETAEMVYLPAQKNKWGGTDCARRERKDGHYFPTFDAAKAELIRRHEASVRYADDERSRAIQALKKAREFKLAE